MKIEISAPGKLILLGEYAVVYQRPCLVSAVSRRLKLRLEKMKRKIFQIEKGDKKGFVKTAIKNFSQKYSLDFGVKIETEKGFRLKYGLGSSAAATVSVLKGLAELAKIKMDKRELFNLAYKTVLDVQGVGSGFDVAAAIYGGTIYFKTGGEKIEKIADFDLPIIVGYSGVKADTPTLVRKVAEEKKRHHEMIERIFDEIENLVEEGKKALLEKNWKGLGELMNINQKLLENLGVSTEKLQRMIYEARMAGAIGAKLSCAGGGDCMIALADEKDRNDVERAIEKAGGRVVKLDFGAEGVRLERAGAVDNADELFVIVDKNDKILGFEKRSKCHHDKSLIHRAIGVVIFNNQGKVLLQKRSENKDVFPGFYTISCSGHVGKGEEYLESAKRELKEELGVEIRLDFCKKFISQSERETEMNALFKGKSEGPFFPNKDEVERVDFFSKKEIKHLLSQGKLLLTHFAKMSLQKMGVLEK